jgi:hypothetical protein
MYNAGQENITLTTAVDVLVAMQSAAAGNAGSILRIIRVEVSQISITTGAQVRCVIAQRTTATTLTTTALTPRPLTIGGPASGITGGTAPTTAATAGYGATVDTGGTYTNTWPCAPHVFNGWLWLPTDKESIWLPPSTLIVVKLMADPSTLTGWDCSVIYEEVF